MDLRPIVSNCNSPTENLSQFVDYWLQPIMNAQPSYLKNSTQLINELRELNINTKRYFGHNRCQIALYMHTTLRWNQSMSRSVNRI